MSSSSPSRVKGKSPLIRGDGDSVRSSSSRVSTMSMSTASTSGTSGTRGTSRAVGTAISDDDQKEPWMHTATPGKFNVLHETLYPIVEEIVKKPEHANHVFTKKWKQLKRLPKNNRMTATISWYKAKIILNIQDLFQYRDFILQCPDIHHYVRFRASKTTRSGFDYGIIASIKSPDIEITDPSNDDSSYVIDMKDSDANQHGDDAHGLTDVAPTETISILVESPHTPKQTNVFLPRVNPLPAPGDETDGPVTTLGTLGNLEIPKDIGLGHNDESTGFRAVHYRLFETATMWTQQDSVKNHPFTLKWRRAVYEGLNSLSKWERVAKLFKLTSLQDYINLMYQCPRIQEDYHLSWDYFENTISYKELALPATEDVIHDINKLNAIQRKMQEMSFRFDSFLKQTSSRLETADAKITACEMNIQEQLNRASSRLASSVTHHYNAFSEYAATTLTTFQSNINSFAETCMSHHRTKLIDMHQANAEKIQFDFTNAEQKFAERLEQAIEQAVQEILNTADDATDNINQQAQIMIEEVKTASTTVKQPHWRDHVKPSKLFPNVDLSSFLPAEKGQPRGDPITLSRGQQDVDSNPLEEWGKDGPEPVLVPSTHTETLPYVNHTDLLKRVHLPYLGREQSYIWYLQLRSNAQQYGIYLIPTESFKKNRSLCPMKVNGIPIEKDRYSDMKCTLYHFLAQRTIITSEYTDLRNIVNRHALTTDGYRVLYDIMERIHPALDPDAIFQPPQSSNYSDIHEYYNYLTSYFMHEEFAGRIYKPREQLNKFLLGLDPSYQPAISRIRRQMDNWSASDDTIPDVLTLSNLPNLIEKYLDEEGGHPVINRLDRRNDRRPRGDGGVSRDLLKQDEDARSYVDTKCNFCQTYGHLKHNCDRMALWLHLKDASKQVDDKMRAKLHANYAAADTKRRDKKLAKIKGTVRQLYHDGNYSDGDKLLEKSLKLYEDADDNNQQTPHDDSDSSQDS
jgi:hypothetical protein